MGIEDDDDITTSATVDEDVALQLAQFCKRSTFSQFFDLAEAHLDIEERNRRAYQMIPGVEAIQAALNRAGFVPG